MSVIEFICHYNAHLYQSLYTSSWVAKRSADQGLRAGLAAGRAELFGAGRGSETYPTRVTPETVL